MANPSTDDLIQWGAHKWGIPEDWLRAWLVDESNWWQGECTHSGSTVPCKNESGYAGISGKGFGDFAQSNFPTNYIPSLSGGGAYTSLGISQVKSRPLSDPHPGTEPLRWKSTAFAIDYGASMLRYYYDGLCSWCNTTYKTRFVEKSTRTETNGWEVIGAWEGTPQPWNESLSKERWEHTRNITLPAHPWTEF